LGSLQIELGPEEQVGAAVSFTDEDAMHEFVGLKKMMREQKRLDLQLKRRGKMVLVLVLVLTA